MHQKKRTLDGEPLGLLDGPVLGAELGDVVGAVGLVDGALDGD